MSGLWHGASWNFIIWGFYHGVIIIIYRILNKSWDKINIIIQTTITFILVSIGWIFFRCGNLDSLMTIKDFNLFDTENIMDIYTETGKPDVRSEYFTKEIGLPEWPYGGTVSNSFYDRPWMYGTPREINFFFRIDYK